jgi:hypothetical protein
MFVNIYYFVKIVKLEIEFMFVNSYYFVKHLLYQVPCGLSELSQAVFNAESLVLECDLVRLVDGFDRFVSRFFGPAVKQELWLMVELNYINLMKKLSNYIKLYPSYY